MASNLRQKFIHHIDKANEVFAWQVLDSLTTEEATEAADIIVRSVKGFAPVKPKLLVDNRFMIRNGRAIVFSPEVNDIWEDAQRTVFPLVSKVAVLCSGAIMKMQMDRISRNSEIARVSQSFWNDDDSVMLREAFEFLGIAANDIVKPR
ncbi:hypothetical protein ABEV74_16165 [Paenibacillus cisolokensis]|jgi:hypothetical protein|uniref:Uncharacterized protein n=1 Tax=Paenibacillus cisolokensis TaxID=1658519 RepID=A0ABQ4NDK4_9BACL|nr:hypothetical protein [Paenibacillus cisolokensis]GIQ66299.1 hypothetical protein PACILC2_48670 [Paenibacillus cisolokensis]